MTERELASKCKKADDEAFTALFNESAPFLLGICRRYLANESDAKDVFQDGFVRIYESIGRFEYKGEGSLKAWMGKVMVNQALNFLKKRKNDALFNSGLMAGEPAVEMLETDENELSQVPQDLLMGFVMQLPDAYRVIFNMYVFEDLSHREIASLLGITETASTTKLYRAKKMLAEMIRKYRKQ